MCRTTHFTYYSIDMHATQRVRRQICVKTCFYLIIYNFFGSFFAKKEQKKRMVRTRLFVVASPAGRKEPPHAVGRWPSASDGRWGFARFPQHARLRVSCGPGMPGPYGRWPGVELLPGRADMESAPTEGIGRKGNNNEVPRASNARPYIVLQFIKTKTPPALAGKRCLFIKLSD